MKQPDKKLTFLFLLFLVYGSAYAQNVGISEVLFVPDQSSILDVSSSSKGMLIPRLALVQTTNPLPVTLPATSLLVYNTATVNDVTPGFYFWNGSVWVRFATGSSGGASGWLLTGNSGTNASTNFIGTTDNIDWVIKTNNAERMRIASSGNIGVHMSPSIYRSINNSFNATSLDNGLNGLNGTLYNNFSANVANNAACAGTVNEVSVNTNFQNQFSQLSGLTAGTYNNVYVNNNGGTNAGIWGKVCGSYNYSFAVSNNNLGRVYGSYNYGLTAFAQPSGAATLGSFSYGIVNSPNSGDIFGSYISGESNGVNNSGGRIYGVYSNAQSNGANNGTIYGIYNISGSNGPNAAGALRYGIYNTWTENAAPSSGNSYGIYNVNGAYPGSTNTVFGLYTEASGGTTNYAIYSRSIGSTFNWAAWFADGNIGVSNTTGIASEIRFFEPSVNGSNYSSFKAQAQASDINYTLPSTLVAGNYLQTDGSGNLSWAAVSGGGGSGQLQYPDGFTSLTPVNQTNLAAIPFVVPAGKNLYITNFYCPNSNVTLTAGGKILVRSYNNFTNSTWDGTAPFNPFIIPPGTTVTVANGPSGNETINGFLVDAVVSPVVLNGLSSAPYIVPAGKILVIMNYYSMSSSANLTVGGNRIYYGYGNFNNTSSGQSWDNIRNPVFVAAGTTVSSNDDGVTINGYLR